MSQYTNDGTGSMFRNEKREREEQPEFRGSANIDGVDYWISAWVNTAGPQTSVPGKKFFSLKFNRKQQAAPQAEPFNDDIPF